MDRWRSHAGILAPQATAVKFPRMRSPSVFTLVVALWLPGAPSAAAAQHDPALLRGKILAYVRSNDVAILGELRDLLAIPNVASDSTNIRRNAAALWNRATPRPWHA